MDNIATSNIISIKWDQMEQTRIWIKPSDAKHTFIKTRLISRFYPSLVTSDKDLLTDGITQVINFIWLKFNFQNKGEILWEQLIQNDLLDLRAIVQMLLPFIKDTGELALKDLTKLEDLYLKQDSQKKFIYTNAQYNRCVRINATDEINNRLTPYFADTEAGSDALTRIIFRPYLKEYFTDHLDLLLMSIDQMANKLYVNWVDVLPMRMDNYKETELYKLTQEKFKSLYVNHNDIFKQIDQFSLTQSDLTTSPIYLTLKIG